MIPLKRVLKHGDVGTDVEAVGRALCTAGVLMPIRVFAALPAPMRRRYGDRKAAAVKKLTKGRTSRYDKLAHQKLWPSFDAKAEKLYAGYHVPPPPPKLIYPLPINFPSSICQSLHQTSGLLGNWAIDFCVPEIHGNGTPILAVEDCTIKKLSGSDPNTDRPDGSGVFGWSVHYEGRQGYRYYCTHLGKRAPLQVGLKLQAGEVIGAIGDQDFRPDHVHLGVTSPLGEADAKKRILEVSHAPKVSARVDV